MEPQKGNVLVKTDICYLIEEVAVRYTSIIEEKKIILSLSCPLNTHWIVASETVLAEVIEILLKNILAFSDQESVIEISITPGDLFLAVEFLNRSKVAGVNQLPAFFADSEDIYHTSLYKAVELTMNELGGDIIYSTSQDMGTFFRLKIKES
jgi:hypothetical protein